MNSRDWFGVGVRLIGVYCLIPALQNLLFFVDVQSNLSNYRESDGEPLGFLLYGIGYVALGVFLLRAAEGLTAFTYRSETEPQDSAESESDSKIQRDV